MVRVVGLLVVYAASLVSGFGFAQEESKAPRRAVLSGLAVSGDGSVFVFGHTIPDGREDIDVVLMKFDADGGRLWVRSFGSEAFDSAMDIAVDGDGNVFLAGTTEGGLVGPVHAEWEPFLVKFDTAGELLWMRQLGGQPRYHVSGVAVDVAGNAYVSMRVFVRGEGRVSFRGPERGVTEAYLAAFSGQDGSRLWLRSLDIDVDNSTASVSVTPEGEILVTGVASETPRVVAPPLSGAFVARLDLSGALLGVFRFGSLGGGEIAVAAVTAPDGSIYSVGSTSGSLGVKDYDRTSHLSLDAFVARHERDGTEVWIRQFGKRHGYVASDVALTAMGHLVVVGEGNGDVGAEPRGLSDVFIAVYNEDGVRLWVDQFGTEEFDDVFAVAAGADDRIYLAGTLARGWDDPYGKQLFLASYSVDGRRLWLKTFDNDASLLN